MEETTTKQVKNIAKPLTPREALNDMKVDLGKIQSGVNTAIIEFEKSRNVRVLVDTDVRDPVRLCIAADLGVLKKYVKPVRP